MGDRLGIPGVVGILLPHSSLIAGACGATVARLTPDQKVACSNHVGVNFFSSIYEFLISISIYFRIFKSKSPLGVDFKIEKTTPFLSSSLFYRAHFCQCEKCLGK